MRLYVHALVPRALLGSKRWTYVTRPSLTLIRASSVYSARSLKRRRQSPSELLVSVLEDHGRHDLVSQLPPHTTKTNLSYLGAWSNNAMPNTTLYDRSEYTRLAPPTLTSLVARAVDFRLSKGPKDPVDFTSVELDYLQLRKYTVEDVDNWLSIFLSKDAKKAARAYCLRDRDALMQAEAAPPKPIPTSLFLLLLRRPTDNFDAETLRFALLHAWHELHRKWTWERRLKDDGITEKDFNAYQLSYPTMDDASVFIMIIRLLRYARCVWPESLVTITAMFTKNFDLKNSQGLESSQRMGQSRSMPRRTRDTERYNRMLKLVSLPASASPFLSLSCCQMAQFNILAKMAESKPPLLITRQGYRSVISLHLASSKTEQERAWDDLKARSWPPWKEEKTGLDAAKGADYGLSKASKALIQAGNAGYGPGMWEKTAQILAGWDIDGSPTIQTRAYHLHYQVSSSSVLQGFDGVDAGTSSSPQLWAARIQATRTVQEAWACFEAYKDRLAQQNRHAAPAANVYGVMLAKLAANLAKVDDRPFDVTTKTRQLSGGDGKEVFPTPESPKEATYVRDPPPPFEELVDDMFARGVAPSSRTLALIITNSPTFDHTLKYLTQAAKHNTKLSSLLLPSPTDDSELQNVPSYIFTAFIISLVSSGRIRNLHSKFASWHGIKPLVVALRFIRANLRHRRSIYYALLKLLTPRRRLEGSPENRLLVAKDNLNKYKLFRDVVEALHETGSTADMTSFRIESGGLQSTILSALEVVGSPLKEEASWEHQESQRILCRSGPEMHSRFVELTVGSSASHDIPQIKSSSLKDASSVAATEEANHNLPRLLVVPYPVVLHRHILVLGLLRDFANLLALVRWMRVYREDIKAAALEPRNGNYALRQCLVALRVFTERPWEKRGGIDDFADADPVKTGGRRSGDLEDDTESSRAPLRLDWLIQIVVDKLELGGWPSDQEVEEYVTHEHFPYREEFLENRTL